jgi:hypothetical protein
MAEARGSSAVGGADWVVEFFEYEDGRQPADAFIDGQIDFAAKAFLIGLIHELLRDPLAAPSGRPWTQLKGQAAGCRALCGIWDSVRYHIFAWPDAELRRVVLLIGWAGQLGHQPPPFIDAEVQRAIGDYALTKRISPESRS